MKTFLLALAIFWNHATVIWVQPGSSFTENVRVSGDFKQPMNSCVVSGIPSGWTVNVELQTSHEDPNDRWCHITGTDPATTNLDANGTQYQFQLAVTDATGAQLQDIITAQKF